MLVWLIVVGINGLRVSNQEQYRERIDIDEAAADWSRDFSSGITDQNGIVRLAISNTNYFKIDGQAIKVNPNNLPDYETASSFKFSVIFSDDDSRVEVELEVNVKNVNGQYIVHVYTIYINYII